MLTKVRIRNFKQFDDVEIELGQTTVLVGPNNSGKTSVLQALTVWRLSNIAWLGSNADDSESVALNRLELYALPVPNLNHLWRNLHMTNGDGFPFIIGVEGVTDDRAWRRDYSLSFANAESLYCEIVANEGLSDHHLPKIVYIPSISGLASDEVELSPRRVEVMVGQGRTAEVLRNLVGLVFDDATHWNALNENMRVLFGVTLSPPTRGKRDELVVTYTDRNGITLDLAASGRGMQQILLLLTYLYTNPGAVLLLDEPDAHLEIIRQRQVYNLLTDVAKQQGAQIIATTHSEVIMEEAFDRDMVVALVGKPHRIDNNSQYAQIVKALESIDAADYYQAEQTGWVLYLEGSTDLAILRTLARRLDHPAAAWLDSPFVHHVGSDEPQRVRDHYFGLREARPDLQCVALVDRIDKQLETGTPIVWQMWTKREIENYITTPETLVAYARHNVPSDVFAPDNADERAAMMQRLIEDRVPPIALREREDAWWSNTKMSDDFLTPLFEAYFKELELPNLMRKTDFHVLADFIPVEQIAPEVTDKLDAILTVAQRAKPRQD